MPTRDARFGLCPISDAESEPHALRTLLKTARPEKCGAAADTWARKVSGPRTRDLAAPRQAQVEVNGEAGVVKEVSRSADGTKDGEHSGCTPALLVV